MGGDERGQAEPQTWKPEESPAVEPKAVGPRDLWAPFLLSPHPLSSHLLMARGPSPDTAGPSSRLCKDSFQHPLR